MKTDVGEITIIAPKCDYAPEERIVTINLKDSNGQLMINKLIKLLSAQFALQQKNPDDYPRVYVSDEMLFEIVKGYGRLSRSVGRRGAALDRKSGQIKKLRQQVNSLEDYVEELLQYTEALNSLMGVFTELLDSATDFRDAMTKINAKTPADKLESLNTAIDFANEFLESLSEETAEPLEEEK